VGISAVKLGISFIICLIAISAYAASVIKPLVQRPVGAGALLLEDNVSLFLLEDNSSSLCFQTGSC
jgi:hypothetical protein